MLVDMVIRPVPSGRSPLDDLGHCRLPGILVSDLIAFIHHVIGRHDERCPAALHVDEMRDIGPIFKSIARD